MLNFFCVIFLFAEYVWIYQNWTSKNSVSREKTTNNLLLFVHREDMQTAQFLRSEPKNNFYFLVCPKKTYFALTASHLSEVLLVINTVTLNN